MTSTSEDVEAVASEVAHFVTCCQNGNKVGLCLATICDNIKWVIDLIIQIIITKYKTAANIQGLAASL